MAYDTSFGTILHTKLYRPPSPGDYVHRPRLLEYLDQRRKRPLTIVSAPDELIRLADDFDFDGIQKIVLELDS